MKLRGGDLQMDFLVCMRDASESAALCVMLQVWANCVCSGVRVISWKPEQGPLPDAAVVFWDMDGSPSLPPSGFTAPRKDRALLVCASDPRRAVECYPLHPAAFLKKPVRPDSLWRAMERCVDAWWESLERLDLLCGGVHRHIPLYSLLWVESSQRGCVFHTSQEQIQIRQPMRELTESLPGHIFLRCHRSFIVNLSHVRSVDKTSLHMSDGAEVPIGRGGRTAALEAVGRFRTMRGESKFV